MNEKYHRRRYQVICLRILILIVFVTATLIIIHSIMMSSSVYSTILNSSSFQNTYELYGYDGHSPTIASCTNVTNQNGLTAVVHIGPAKTGTTSIQSWSKILLKQLVSDGYELPWHVRLTKESKGDASLLPKLIRATSISRLYKPINMVQVASCFMSKDHDASRYCQPVIADELSGISENGDHLLLTAELFATFDADDVDRLYKTLSKNYQNIVIVLYYRRYSDWIVSRYHEMNKRNIYNREPFLDFLSKFERIENDIFDNYIMTRSSKCYSNITIKIYNFHNLTQFDNDLLISFYCDAIPNAAHTCNKYKELSVQLTQLERQNKDYNTTHDNLIEETAFLKRIRRQLVANHAIPFVYNDIVLAAKQMDMIPIEMSDRARWFQLVKTVRKYQEETLNLSQYDFIDESVTCIDESIQEQILQKTIKIENMFFPESFASQRTITSLQTTSKQADNQISNFYNETIRQLRSHMEKKRKALFCDVNASIVLKRDSRWQQFFKSITV